MCLPIHISIPVYNDLDYDINFIIEEPEGKLQGYHIVIICGYNKFGYIIQNSWGKYWGDKGQAILPYDYPIDSTWGISTNKNTVNKYQTIW